MTTNIAKLKLIAVALAIALGLSATATSAAYAEGWYAGIQQNSTSFTIKEKNVRDVKYVWLVNQTFVFGRDFDLGYVLRNLTFGIEGSIGLGKSSSDTGNKKHRDRNVNFGGSAEPADAGEAAASSNIGNGTRLYNLSRAIDNELSFRVRAVYSLADYLNDDAWVYGTLGFARINTEGIRSNGYLPDPLTLDTYFEPLKDEAVYGLTYGIGGEIGIPETPLSVRLEYNAGAYERLSLGTVYKF